MNVWIVNPPWYVKIALRRTEDGATDVFPVGGRTERPPKKIYGGINLSRWRVRKFPGGVKNRRENVSALRGTNVPE